MEKRFTVWEYNEALGAEFAHAVKRDVTWEEACKIADDVLDGYFRLIELDQY